MADAIPQRYDTRDSIPQMVEESHAIRVNF